MEALSGIRTEVRIRCWNLFNSSSRAPRSRSFSAAIDRLAQQFGCNSRSRSR